MLYFASSVSPGVQQPATCFVYNVPLRGSADILPRPVSDADCSFSLRRAAVLLLQRLQKAVSATTKSRKLRRSVELRVIVPPMTVVVPGIQSVKSCGVLSFTFKGACGASSAAVELEWLAKPSRTPLTSSRRGSRWGASTQPDFSLDR